jgi:hypothetical protein
MPDGQKVVQVPGLGNVAFPGTMDDASINAAIKTHLSTAQISARAASDAADKPTAGSMAREAALGVAGGLGIPETQTPIRDLYKNLMATGKQVGTQLATDIPSKGVPVALGQQIINMVTGAGKQALGYGKELGVSGGYGSINSDFNAASHGAGGLLGMLLGSGLLKKTPEAMTDPLGREAMQNVMNQGPSKAGFIHRQVERANATQSAVKSTLDAVHEDGKQLMSGVSKHIDSAESNGAFNRADVHAAVKDAMGVVKADQKVPAAITKVLDTFKPDDTGGWMQKGGKAAKGPTVGGKTLDLTNPSDKAAFEKYKNAGVFTPEEAARYEGGGSPEGKMSFEELKQIHSDIGRQIANTEGAVEAGVKAAYSKLGEMLRNKAESHGMLNEWSEGASKVKTFYDTAYRSPLKDTYFGSNHGKIMKPLVSDDLGPTVWKQLEKVAPYGLDMDKLKQTVDGYRYGKKMDMLNEPSRMTPILAAISPKMAALRIAIPRGMRTAGMTEHLYGKGLENVPEVPTSKIYPSAKAAAKARSGWETSDEAARRGASGVNPATKSARRHYEKNR